MINFIVNSRSGMGQGHKNIKAIMDYCYKNKVEYTVHITGAPGHASKIASVLSELEPTNTIAAVGGDGTFHEVLNGVVDPKITPIGFIPSGRGNDYARAANLSLSPITALKAIINNKIVYSDYIQIGDKRCLNVAGTGLDIDVLQRVDGRNGKITYLLSLLHCLANFKPYQIKVTTNGESKEYDAIMVGICNGIAIGGGMRLSPLSKVDDGKINVIIITMPADGNLMSIVPKFKKGKHINMPLTTHYLCDEVTVESLNGKPIQLDGEIYNESILDCKIKAGGLKTFSQI